MLSQIISNLKKILPLLLGILILHSCIPDRLPTEPIENTRPEFVSIQIEGGSNLVVKRDAEISTVFNEKMDLSTFPGNFTLKSAVDEITGEFSQQDSIVKFSPSGLLSPAQYYEVKISGKVRDVNGNSVVSPNEEDQIQSTWFFTEGDYSQNGFPLVFIRDKSEKQVIHRIGNLNKNMDQLVVNATVEDYQTAAIEFSPTGQYLYMVNLKTVNGTITVIDPKSFSIVKTIDVGLGPTNIYFSNDKGYVSNTSGKSITTINTNNLETISTYEFADGFKPKDMVYSNITNKFYVYSSSAKQIKVLNADNFDNNYNLDEILTDSKAIDIEITNNGRYIYLIQDRTDKILVFDVQNDALSHVIETGNPYLIDGAMGDQYYYAAFFKKIDKELVGGVSKIDLASNSVISTTFGDKEIDQLGLTNAQELLYAIVPVDSTIRIFETETIKEISSTKVPGSLKYLAVSKNNYE